MTTNKALTYGAVAFAAFAVWWITRTPGKAVAMQPGQQQRDMGLANWVGLLDAQSHEIYDRAYADYNSASGLNLSGTLA